MRLCFLAAAATLTLTADLVVGLYLEDTTSIVPPPDRMISNTESPYLKNIRHDSILFNLPPLRRDVWDRFYFNAPREVLREYASARWTDVSGPFEKESMPGRESDAMRRIRSKFIDEKAPETHEDIAPPSFSALFTFIRGADEGTVSRYRDGWMAERILGFAEIFKHLMDLEVIKIFEKLDAWRSHRGARYIDRANGVVAEEMKSAVRRLYDSVNSVFDYAPEFRRLDVVIPDADALTASRRIRDLVVENLRIVARDWIRNGPPPALQHTLVHDRLVAPLIDVLRAARELVPGAESSPLDRIDIELLTYGDVFRSMCTFKNPFAAVSGKQLFAYELYLLDFGKTKVK